MCTPVAKACLRVVAERPPFRRLFDRDDGGRQLADHGGEKFEERRVLQGDRMLKISLRGVERL
ncbi:MAG: hypothetical protein BRD26_08400 [Bacteroidetes bacterium QH_1_64_81]|nr:MAG: hypothetical protein BRD26_08400 [Bacteroidetes bacterium QH_1_64_81]